MDQEARPDPRQTDATPVVPDLSVVVPVFNEQEALPLFDTRLRAVLNGTGLDHETLYVNDGSTDRSLILLEDFARRHPGVGLVNLSRNFGKELAITAGLDHARGSAVVVIDADLQDPPELIPALISGWHEGFDVVYAQRRSRVGESWLKRATARRFYLLMGHVGQARLPPDVGDFRLITRRVVEALGQLREHHRFMKGLFAWVGFPSKAVLYDRAPRAAGQTKWSYWRLWNLALDGITSYTVMPLKIATYLGVVVALFSVLYGGFMVVRTLLIGNRVPGYPSLMTAVLFLGGVQLMTLGIIGEYLGRVFNETKQRPLYIVEHYAAATSPGDAAATSPADDTATSRVEDTATSRAEDVEAARAGGSRA
jgi:polyisoprenyl-phosphate glycosyltransferase